MTDDDHPRTQLRLYCNRPHGGHTLGKVRAGREGLSITWHEAVYSRGSVSFVDRTEALREQTMRQAYCPACGKEFVIFTSTLESALADRDKAQSLEPLGMFVDPVGVSDRREGRD